MADEDVTGIPQRERSKIRFPYGSLADAIKVAEVVHDQHGGSCSMDQLAASMGHVLDSGTFRVKVYTTATFGLLKIGQGSVTLLPLGNAIINPESSARAKVDAFMRVPLYGKVYEQYKGKLLPKDEGLENFLVGVGVSEKQANKARRAMQRSAETAGFFSAGKDRLGMPSGLGSPSALLNSENQENNRVGSDRSGDDAPGDGDGKVKMPEAAEHPLIFGLLSALPAPGRPFSAEDRKTWLDAANLNFSLIYGKARDQLGNSSLTDEGGTHAPQSSIH